LVSLETYIDEGFSKADLAGYYFDLLQPYFSEEDLEEVRQLAYMLVDNCWTRDISTLRLDELIQSILCNLDKAEPGDDKLDIIRFSCANE